jgi:hypothetical protein
LEHGLDDLFGGPDDTPIPASLDLPVATGEIAEARPPLFNVEEALTQGLIPRLPSN